MKEELKPCPFCGENVRYLHRKDEFTNEFVCIIDCQTESCIFYSCMLSNYRVRNLPKDEFIKKWNTRPSEK